MKKGIFAAATILVSIPLIISCNKDDDSIPVYTTPLTYDFTNVEYAEASGRVSMWAGLTSYLGKSTSRQLSQDTANFLWNNTGNAFTAEISSNLPFTPAALNAAGVSVASKAADAATVKVNIDSMVKISQYYAATASNGVPGKIGNRLFNYSGLEFNQLVAKGLMGALQLNQVYVYLDKTVTDDNTTVVAGQGTAMQHDWDLAFGYLGIPKDYDSAKVYVNTDPTRPLAIGGYFRERGRFIKAGGTVFSAFLKGRAAIGAKDYAARNQAIADIKAMLEKTLAAAAYEYSGIAQTSTVLADRFHAMSEGYGFVLALKHRSVNSLLTTVNYQLLLDIFKTNFYELAADANNTKLKQARTIFSTAYGQLQAN